MKKEIIDKAKQEIQQDRDNSDLQRAKEILLQIDSLEGSLSELKKQLEEV